MISLDTNVVLRFLIDDVPDQTERVAQLVEQNRVYVTDVVTVEIIYVLEKVLLLSRKDIADLLRAFLGLSQVVSNPYFLINAIDLYEQHPRLSIVDCYAASEAKAYNNQLATFDKKLATQGGASIKEF